ncbi:hypothetical protein BJP36_37040 [Moorena producens JHB]|uniref:Uncharacterized protein n=1 Tax=Moorena producens (strain JHB) TaxID=1454205 RepID=A0A9Q9SU47_MOOP1|nr:hypothetical protein [Moorena producens]WAN69702.1 hypothetical protein BJP36_37040 [Moorena producens JHB]
MVITLRNWVCGISPVVSIQPSAVSRQPSADLTQIKQMLTCFIQNAFLINKHVHSP